MSRHPLRRTTSSTGRARVGCSGWSYADWRGRLYPEGLPQRRWIETYAQEFDTVELNSTFYRLPSESAVAGWRTAATPGFSYSVKVGQFGTHRKKLLDPTTWLARHVDRVRLLGPHLGPQLVQLPPHWRRNVARLDEFLDAAPTDLRWAVELRDPSWLCDDVFDVLERHGAALCWHDLLPAHPWERTADFTYVRLHGPKAPDQPYHGRYGARRLDRLAGRLQERLDDGDDVAVYFNNDQGGAAVDDARHLRDRLGSAAGSSLDERTVDERATG